MTDANEVEPVSIEKEHQSLMETLYLLGVPGMKERLLEGSEIPVEKCDEFVW